MGAESTTHRAMKNHIVLLVFASVIVGLSAFPYNKESLLANMNATAASDPCCVGACNATAGLEKYWSIASSIFGTKHCGECCMSPSDYALYHFFESNLTKSDSDYPCKSFGYTKYDSTETHGLGPISMTLDLYDVPS